MYAKYIVNLQKVIESAEKIEEEVKIVQQLKEQVSQEVIGVSSEVRHANEDERLVLFERNIDLKKKIQETLRNISAIHASVKKAFQDSNDAFSKKPVKETPKYKAASGDPLDQMLGEILNRLGLAVPISRLGGGYYMFGTKKIYCKIINGKLVVRVGGGYMAIEEFIVQYGPQEIEKIRIENEAKKGVDLANAQKAQSQKDA